MGELLGRCKRVTSGLLSKARRPRVENDGLREVTVACAGRTLSFAAGLAKHTGGRPTALDTWGESHAVRNDVHN